MGLGWRNEWGWLFESPDFSVTISVTVYVTSLLSVLTVRSRGPKTALLIEFGDALRCASDHVVMERCMAMRHWFRWVRKTAYIPLCFFLIIGCASIPVSLDGRLCSSKSLLLKPEKEKNVVVSGSVLRNRNDVSRLGNCESAYEVILSDEKRKLFGVPFGCAEQEFEPGSNTITAAIGKVIDIFIADGGGYRHDTVVESLGNTERRYLPGVGPVDKYFTGTYDFSSGGVYALCASKEKEISLQRLSIDYPTYRQKNPPKGIYTAVD